MYLYVASEIVACNFRPKLPAPTILSTTSKILERLIYLRLIKVIYPQISSNQFGFLPNRSCLHKLLITTDIMQSVNNKNGVDVIYMDMQKAFDSVRHNQLLLKLMISGFNIPNVLWLWLQDYLTNHWHKVVINGHSSTVLPVLSGVPQGSILGSLLFLTYINDMASVPLYSSLFLFADDSQCLNQIRSSQDRYNLQTDLDSISLWATRQHLKFNASKCHHLHFGPVPKTQSHKFMINDSVIPTTSEHKDLGVIFNSNLYIIFLTHQPCPVQSL